jgi:hypothetical protein
MKQVAAIILMTSASVLFSSCHKNSIKGEGPVTTDSRSVSSFHAVEANGEVDVEVHPSATNRVVVTGYHNLVPVYRTRVQEGRLVLEFEDSYWNVRNNNIKVDVYAEELTDVRINGSGDTYVEAGVKGENMNAEINGSGNITIGDNSYQDMTLNVNGSGDIDARSARTETADADISGSGNIRLTVHNYLNARISGSGTIDYWGHPERVDTEVTGSGRIRKQ